MNKAVKLIFIVVGMMILFTSCGRKDAQEVLLTEAQTATPEATISPTETPVIQVVCNCNCNCNGQDQEGQTGSAATEDTSPAEASAAPEITATESPASETTATESAVPEATAASDSGKVNINTADSSQLQTLNGIGETRANAIISYRESYGGFRSVEDIMNVEGIKDGIFNKIKDDISVE